ncbi:MAG: flagellar biosynthetic protein FliR [Verrucomicrobiaceae bacterium]|nr:flagellar biosynthetic protein FliR [Verrucomicrobiaceae bacterium]
MFQLDIATLQNWLHLLLWPLMRISAFCMVAPIFSAAFVPPRVRLIFSILLTLIIAPTLQNLPHPDMLSLESVLMVAQQLLIGIGLALFLQMLMQAFVVSGQFIATQMGLGFSSLNDPMNGVSVTTVSQLYLMMATLLFLSLNGHLVMIDVLIESFRTLPVGMEIGDNRLQTLFGWGSWMFAAALMMALPAVTALLIINCSLGVVTRAAPQLNIFAIGFPLMLLLGFLILWTSLGNVLPNFERYNGEVLDIMRQWVS